MKNIYKDALFPELGKRTIKRTVHRTVNHTEPFIASLPTFASLSLHGCQLLVEHTDSSDVPI